MITVTLNQKKLILNDDCVLSDALRLHYNDHTSFSIAINREFIPKKNYSTIFLKDNDIIETITAMQGG